MIFQLLSASYLQIIIESICVVKLKKHSIQCVSLTFQTQNDVDRLIYSENRCDFKKKDGHERPQCL